MVAEPAGAPVLRIEDLRVRYGKLEILHGVNLSVAAREVVSLIGPNGAGKSTVLKTIMGFLKPHTGAIWFDGADIAGMRPDLVVRRGVGYVPQGRIVFPRMTVVENLEMGGYTVRDKRQLRHAMEQVFGLFPRLAERRGQLAGSLSGGEQQMLAMGRALMIQPRLLVLDEPSLGLAPRFVELVFDRIASLRTAGPTVLLVEQNATRALAISDRGYVLELGSNRFVGSGTELLADPQVRRLYLGDA